MFLSRVPSLVVAVLALVSAPSEAISLRRRLGATYSSDSNDWRQTMLAAVNEQRANNGLSSLCLNSKLTTSAQAHSDDMATNNFMDHDGSDGSTMASRITAAGYEWQYVAENVAAGQVDVDSVMTSWMNSEGHRANILSKDITMFGCGYAYSESSTYGHYWTQDFGAGSSESCDDSSSSSATSTKDDDQVANEASEAADDSSAYTPETTAPVTEAPATDAPATEAPATEAPATEAPATEAPATEAPATEAPATEAPATEAPATKAPSTEAPTSGGCRVRRH